MDLLVLIVHVLAAAGIIGLVLVQHGKGADVGASFGTGSAGSVFGSAGSANFLSRLTAGLAVVFFVTSIGLSFLSNKRATDKGVMGNVPAATQAAPDKAPGVSDLPTVPAAKSGGAPADVPSAPGQSEAKGDAKADAKGGEAPKK